MNSKQVPKFRETKAIASASILLQLSGGKCDKYWLNKLMYYIERESLLKSGQPMFFDKLFSLPHGPIVSAINDGIDSANMPGKSKWGEYFELTDNSVILKYFEDDSILSEFEIEIITEAFDKFKGWSFPKLKNYFDNLPENKITTSRELIDYEEILKLNGASEFQIKEAISEISYLSFIENSLDCAK